MAKVKAPTVQITLVTWSYLSESCPLSTMVKKKAEEQKPRIFISYARSDAAIAESMRVRLINAGFDAFLDKHDIAPGEPWRPRLGKLIARADKVVFLVSPKSIASTMCEWEIDEAERLGKPLLPIVIANMNIAQAPEKLRRLQVMFQRTDVELASGFAALCRALRFDLAWEREKTHWSDQAEAWDRAGRPQSLLIARDQTLRKAESWRDAWPPNAPPPTPTQRAFLAQSRDALGRRQRRVRLGLGLVAAVTTIAAVVAVAQSQRAARSEAQTIQVLATSDFQQGARAVARAGGSGVEGLGEALALLARSARLEHEPRAAARLWALLQQRSFWVPVGAPQAPTAVASRDGETGRGAAPDIRGDAPDAVKRRFARIGYQDMVLDARSVSMSADGSRVFVSFGGIVDAIDVRYVVFSADAKTLKAPALVPYDGGTYVASADGTFNENGRYLAIQAHGWRETTAIHLVDLKSGETIGEPVSAGGILPESQFQGFADVQLLDGSRDDLWLITASARGDARAHLMQDGRLFPNVQVRHRAPVAHVAVGEEREWFISADQDGVVRVSDLNSSAPIGQSIRLEAAPSAVAREGDGLAVTMDGGVRRFRLLGGAGAPARRRLGGGGELAKDAGPPPALEAECLRWRDAGAPLQADVEADSGVLEHRTGARIVRDGPRSLTVRSAEDSARTARLPVDIAVACFDRSGTRVAIYRVDHRVEIHPLDLSGPLYPIIDEVAFFGASPADKLESRLVGDRVILRNFLFDPPNLSLTWMSVWDAASGLPLTDQFLFTSDDDELIADARLVSDGSRLRFLGREIGSGDAPLSPMRFFTVTPPETVAAVLPDLMEAVGGVRFGADGAIVPVENRALVIAELSKIVEPALER